MEMKMNEQRMQPCELSLDELDNASGGFLWIGAVVGGFALGTAIRYGIDWAVKKMF